MAKPKYAGPESAIKLYDKLIATQPNIERKGAKNPYTSLNGHMFSFLARNIRLSPEDQQAYGTVMGGYVEIPDAFFKTAVQLKKTLAASIEYASSL